MVGLTALVVALLVLAAPANGLRTSKKVAPTMALDQRPFSFKLPDWGSSGIKRTAVVTKISSPSVVVTKYFEHWNQREMTLAIDLFAEDCTYEDTLYPDVFTGKDALKGHLLNVASALPESFEFCIDAISEDPNNGNVGIQWHVESDGQPLPFTRGCSMYTINSDGLICKGFDIPEPVVKAGSINLGILSLAKKLISEPIRAVPVAFWALYCWGLFLSDALPGVNALALDGKTWQEVIDLSLNFWLVLPILQPEAAPHLHPVFEGSFNLVLAWSALFAGFLIDGKKVDSKLSLEMEEDASEANEMLPTVLGMQFLTNAIYLPYLINREGAPSTPPVYSSLSAVEKVAESKALPVVLGGVGSLSIYWAVLGRVAETPYSDFSVRFSSYFDFISHDRLGFSFIIDLIYFACFQGWLLDDDLLRRGVSEGQPNASLLKAVGKYVPFFGLLYYLAARPPLAVAAENTDRLT